MDDTKVVKQYLKAFDQSLKQLQGPLHAVLTTPLTEQLNQSTSPHATIKLANGSAYLLVSLCFAYLKSQGVDTSKHPIMADLNRVKSYMKRLADLEKKQDEKEEKDDEETLRAKEFIKSALGQSTAITGDVGPAISFKGTHTRFEENNSGENEDKKSDRIDVAKVVGGKIRHDKKKKIASRDKKRDKKGKVTK